MVVAEYEDFQKYDCKKQNAAAIFIIDMMVDNSLPEEFQDKWRNQVVQAWFYDDESAADIPSEVKSHLSGTISLHDPEEAAFEKSVDDAIRFDDSRLQDMPPREPGV